MTQAAPTPTEHHLRPTALGSRTWLGIVIIGLVGQIAWTVENLYLNVFVYDTVTDDPTVIDWFGNLVYRNTARNFNPEVATAGRITVAEVEEIVPPGELDPNHIHTPGIYVNRIIVGEHYDKPIEFRTTTPAPGAR